MLALVALMASAAEPSTTYSADLKPIKQVVKSEKRAKLLAAHPAVSRKKAPSADQFEGLTMYVNLTNSNDWANASIGSVPYGIYSITLGGGDFTALATDLRYNFMASAMGREQLVGARPMELFGNLNGVEYNGLSRDDFHEMWSQVYDQVDYSFIPSVMAYDVTSDIIYSVQYNADLTGLNMAACLRPTPHGPTASSRWPWASRPMARCIAWAATANSTRWTRRPVTPARWARWM